MVVVLKRRDHVDDPTCWCRVAVLTYPEGQVIVHNDEVGARLGLYAVLYAEWVDGADRR